MFNINLSNEYSGLISFRMDWLDLLAVQGTLKSLLQHHSSKPSILWCSAFFIVQLLGADEFHVFEQQWKILLVVCGDWFFSCKFREIIYILKSSSIAIFSSHRCYWYKFYCICLSAYIYSEGAQSCPTLCNPVDCSLPGFSILGFSRQEYWSGLPFPSQGIFPTQGSDPDLPHWRQTL